MPTVISRSPQASDYSNLPPEEQQEKWLDEATAVVKQQAFFMKRALVRPVLRNLLGHTLSSPRCEPDRNAHPLCAGRRMGATLATRSSTHPTCSVSCERRCCHRKTTTSCTCSCSTSSVISSSISRAASRPLPCRISLVVEQVFKVTLHDCTSLSCAEQGRASIASRVSQIIACACMHRRS